MMQDFYKNLTVKNDEIISKIEIYLKSNLSIILFFIAVALAAYGFELFNLNLTIDEELVSLRSGVITWNLEIGRWGKYFLEKILFPFSVIPFAPLFVALIFQIMAILLIIETFGISSKKDQIILGAIAISYPGMAFMYSFTIANYLVGIGLFCISLSLFLYIKNTGKRKFLALIPAVLAVSIYQPFIPVLISVYLLYIIYFWNETGFRRISEIKNISMIILFAIFLYAIIQKLLLNLYKITNSGYVESFFDLNYLRENLPRVIKKLSIFIFYFYSGDETIYGIEIRAIGILLFVLGLGIIFQVFRLKAKFLDKLTILFLLFVFMLLPFLGGLLTQGSIPIRSLVGIPLILSGWVIIGLKNQSNLYKSFVALLTVLCVFQFISSSNHLFASSHIALEEDRILGTQLIEKIEEAKSVAGSDSIHYLEVIGFVKRPEIPLVSRIDIIGASFFGWDQGHSNRVVAFLKTLGYYGLEPLPLEKRSQIVAISDSMSIWPNMGSVKVFGDIVVVKFGDYSNKQRSAICQFDENIEQLQTQGFCP